MADRQIGNHLGVALRTANQNGGASATDAFDDADCIDLAAMRARLTAIDAVTYTASRLNQMSVNDMVFAIRTLDNPTTL